jgi:hypothetical protein
MENPRAFTQELNPDWHIAICPRKSAESGSTTWHSAGKQLDKFFIPRQYFLNPERRHYAVDLFYEAVRLKEAATRHFIHAVSLYIALVNAAVFRSPSNLAAFIKKTSLLSMAIAEHMLDQSRIHFLDFQDYIYYPLTNRQPGCVQTVERLPSVVAFHLIFIR